MRSQAARTQVKFDIRIAEDFPLIECDLAKLKQILFNLLSNALKFSPDDTTVTITGELIEREGEEWFELAVRDEGVGIAIEHQQLIFEEFRQVEKTIAAGGTGLGLALVRRFVELLKGEVAVESTLGKGSTFTVRLPMKFRGTATVSDVKDEPISGDGELVLIVEDDDEAYRSINGYVTASGYQGVRARRGDEALRLAKSLHPVAITLDIILPVMDGWEILKQLKSDTATADIPVVIISLIDNRELGLALGAHDYILKPVDRARLIERLRKITGKNLGKRPRLLLIDDDPAFHALLETELQLLGYEVRSAFNGEAGVSLATSENPDAIVLDLLMPGLTGFQVAERLKQQASTAKIPIVVMTSKDLTEEDRRLLNSHVARFVPKGSSPALRLVSAIRALQIGVARIEH
jgi:CheY-like chemotaxis protein